MINGYYTTPEGYIRKHNGVYKEGYSPEDAIYTDKTPIARMYDIVFEKYYSYYSVTDLTFQGKELDLPMPFSTEDKVN